MDDQQNKQRSLNSTRLDSTGLSLTTSNNSSLASYNSSIAVSTGTKNSTHSSFTGKVKNLVSRKRSQSLNIGPLNTNSTHEETTSSSPSSTSSKFRLLRNKSVTSIFPTSLPSLIPSHSSSTTRDNSISSLSDFELEFPLSSPLSPLGRIEENAVDRTGVSQTVGKKSIHKPLTESEFKVYDDIADNIMDKVVNEDSVVEWNF